MCSHELGAAWPTGHVLTYLGAEQISEFLGDEPPFRTAQLLHAVYRTQAKSFEEITTLPVHLRNHLASRVKFTSIGEPQTELSVDGTHKALFRTPDGAAFEAVQLPSERGSSTTVCLSSQAGCAMGCTFCSTGSVGFTRDLVAAEIVDQFLYFRRRSSRKRVPDRVVFMGMGEPLANLPNLYEAITTLLDPERVGLGARRITVSTIGLPAGIDRLARWGWKVGLAISLHAPDDAVRAQLVPLARSVPIADLMEASRTYQRLVGRRVSYEYTLIAGVNDSVRLAGRLAELVRGQRCHVNLIPFNPYPGTDYLGATRVALRAFRDKLRTAGIATTIRRTRGRDISGACGQLHAGVLDGSLGSARNWTTGASDNT